MTFGSAWGEWYVAFTNTEVGIMYLDMHYICGVRDFRPCRAVVWTKLDCKGRLYTCSLKFGRIGQQGSSLPSDSFIPDRGLVVRKSPLVPSISRPFLLDRRFGRT